MVEQREEIGRRTRENDLQGPVIERAESNLRKVGDLSGVKGFGIGDRIKHVGDIRPEGRGKNPLIGVDKVPGGDWIAVGPPRLASQMERVGFFVRGDFPPLRHSRDGMKIVRILADESLQQRGEDIERADAIDDVRIKVLHFLAVPLVKDLKAVPFFDGRLRALAGSRERKKNKEPRINTDFHGCTEGF